MLVQIPLLWSVPLPEPVADHAREFAQRYRTTASLELFRLFLLHASIVVLPGR